MPSHVQRFFARPEDVLARSMREFEGVLSYRLDSLTKAARFWRARALKMQQALAGARQEIDEGRAQLDQAWPRTRLYGPSQRTHVPMRTCRRRALCL